MSAPASPDQSPTEQPPALCRAAFTTEEVARIQAAVDQAPPLTDRQRQRIETLLRPSAEATHTRQVEGQKAA